MRTLYGHPLNSIPTLEVWARCICMLVRGGFQWANTLLFLHLFHLFLWKSPQRIADAGSQPAPTRTPRTRWGGRRGRGNRRGHSAEAYSCIWPPPPLPCAFSLLSHCKDDRWLSSRTVWTSPPHCPHSQIRTERMSVCASAEGQRRPPHLGITTSSKWAHKLNVTGVTGRWYQSSGVKRFIEIQCQCGCGRSSQRHDVSALKSHVFLWSREPVTGSHKGDYFLGGTESTAKSRGVN